MHTDVSVKILAHTFINDTFNIDVLVVRTKSLASRNGKLGIFKVEANDHDD